MARLAARCAVLSASSSRRPQLRDARRHADSTAVKLVAKVAYGRQPIDIMKVAGAEQHFFIDAAPTTDPPVLLGQFEPYPDNTHT